MQNANHIFLENVLTEKECDIIQTAYLNYIENGWKGTYDDRAQKNSISISHPYKNLKLNSIHDHIDRRITPLIKKYFKDTIEYSHAYLRLYKNGSFLPMHNDRNKLDITLSVNIAGIQNWPLHISNIECEKFDNIYTTNDEVLVEKIKKNHSSFLTPRGSGVVCYAYKYPHWRDELVCEDHEYVLQLFYHWEILN